jgi:predicted DNA-binding transcriptional regulator YafY
VIQSIAKGRKVAFTYTTPRENGKFRIGTVDRFWIAKNGKRVMTIVDEINGGKFRTFRLENVENLNIY